jgi:hypothetical protein
MKAGTPKSIIAAISEAVLIALFFEGGIVLFIAYPLSVGLVHLIARDGALILEAVDVGVRLVHPRQGRRDYGRAAWVSAVPASSTRGASFVVRE